VGFAGAEKPPFICGFSYLSFIPLMFVELQEEEKSKAFPWRTLGGSRVRWPPLMRVMGRIDRENAI
jgi:hypothetical protein